MSTSRVIARAVLTLALSGVAGLSAQQAKSTPLPHPAAPRGPGLGVPATTAEIAAMDVSIPPDGAGLPPGSGTPAEGAQAYAVKCVPCHGVEGAGGLSERLVGGQGTLTTASPVKTIGSYWPYATTLFDYIRRAMPYPQPHSLTDPEAYALTAYLLNLNGVIGTDSVMNATTLPRVEMPNRGNFIRAYPPRTDRP